MPLRIFTVSGQDANHSTLYFTIIRQALFYFVPHSFRMRLVNFFKGVSNEVTFNYLDGSYSRSQCPSRIQL